MHKYRIRANETWSVIVEYAVEAENQAEAIRAYRDGDTGLAELIEVVGAGQDQEPLVESDD